MPGGDQRPPAQAAAATVPVTAQPQAPASEPEPWGSEEEYGEYLAAPQELASVHVNDIVNSMRLNARAMRLGEIVYEKNCAECHGADLKGLAGKNTPDLTDGVWRFLGDDYASVGRIKVPSDPRFRNKRDTEDFGTAALLSETEIVEMVEYVLQLSAQPHDEAMARRAAVLFQDHTKGNCYDCHGRDGRGIAAFGSTDLTDRKMYLYGADRASIHESITKGRHGVMPGFDGVLKPEELKAVSVYTFSHAQK